MQTKKVLISKVEMRRRRAIKRAAAKAARREERDFLKRLMRAGRVIKFEV